MPIGHGVEEINFLINGLASSFSEISNDAGLTGNSKTAVVTEFAAKNFYDSLIETPPFIRKNFVHKGTVVSGTETHFNAFTASVPFGFDPPSIKDFFVLISIHKESWKSVVLPLYKALLTYLKYR